MKKAIALILSLVMCVSLFTACGKQGSTDDQGTGTTAKTLVVGTQNFDGKFSPFFYTNSYENDVMNMVFDGLLLTGGCADPYGWKAVRSSMGAVFRRPIYSGTPEELAALIEASKNGQMAPAMTEKEETGDEEN